MSVLRLRKIVEKGNIFFCDHNCISGLLDYYDGATQATLQGNISKSFLKSVLFQRAYMQS